MSTRYARQMQLPEVGDGGQAWLRAARVLVAGAGGLGSPVLSYLAGAGLGCLVVVDPDRVDESNLHRQPLYRMDDIGRPKAEAAAEAITRLNPEVQVEPHVERLDPANVSALARGADVVIDAGDSYALTFTLSDHCRDSGQALISASVLGFSGYAGGFCGGAPSVRALFPDPPDNLQSCANAGVSGPAVGMLGALQAQLALNHLLGLSPSSLGRLVTLDLKTLALSSFSFANAPEPDTAFPFIAAGDIGTEDLVIDLRSAEEALRPATPSALRVLPPEIGRLERPEDGARTVLCCRSGLRAWRAAHALEAKGFSRLALVALG
ncbi:MAG: ThiF family adenylyltransferase [Parvibaculaceae bacterium]